MAYEIATAIILVAIVGLMAWFYSVIEQRQTKDHTFLKLIFFMLCFPLISGIAYYAKVLAEEGLASSTQISILGTFYKFTILILIVMYAYLGIRTLLWTLSFYKEKGREPWEENNELI